MIKKIITSLIVAALLALAVMAESVTNHETRIHAVEKRIERVESRTDEILEILTETRLDVKEIKTLLREKQ